MSTTRPLPRIGNFFKSLNGCSRPGSTFFLQIHDFAEDGRPNLYFKEDYPANCHYGVINARDSGILLRAGLDRAGLHHIPNAVESLPADESRHPKPQILYPVRALRRKNLGEAILLSLFLRVGRRLAVTQPPNSPTDAVSYRDWICWVRENRLNVDFGVGKNIDFSKLVSASESVITTSIAEGFGLCFLETWTAGKLLWGRRLGDICADFEDNGIHLDSFYDRLYVPMAWINADAFSRKWHEAVLNAAERYGHIIAADAINRAFARLTHDDRIDFGLLGEKFQRQVLVRLISDPVTKAELISLNPWLSQPGEVSDPSAMIESNRRAVERQYGLQQYRNRLLAIYDQVVNHPVYHRIDKGALCNALIDLDRFSLLQWGAYDG